MAHSSTNTPAAKHVAGPVMPSESELVEFDHSAAGHQGISSNASGSLLIKPCTQAEIDFYESAKDHPLFQAHMPTFIGSLSQHEDQEAVKPLLQEAATTSTVTAAVPNNQDSVDNDNGNAAVADPTSTMPELVKRTSWKPSGGKKLSTGLAIVLENVTAGFKQPNILDVKLGARLWDDDAPQAKRRKLDEVSQRTTSGSLGFRVAGMKLWCGPETTAMVGDQTPKDNKHEDKQEQTQQDNLPNGSSSNNNSNNSPDEPESNVEYKRGYKSYTKLYGQSFTKDNVVDAFTTYLGGVRSDETTGKPVFRRKHAPLIAKRLIRELESIQYSLENEESRMYSASVLMVYEGDESALESALEEEEKERNGQTEDDDQDGRKEEKENEKAEEEEEEDDDDGDDIVPQKVHEVRLIDFAHASWTPGQGPDENALQGVRSLIGILKGLLDE
ncbi:hypothetical protein ABEF92_004080 [Exophiala dermatitidis]|uniref:Kinase n=1 Tax=Exophiala dermatitidis (strain ATCC 34100 / CBS 525.76 / NIH/UT8656) TaxID=858893 RepID=H6BMW3_EXODN|nr:inositol-polyphosphate multikinase [Exophiala dermatitidis NIH/UT8656]EHY53086.1 inositol-polyphosphate multikinase [Exophiala dermatitidis NIH/UT8656]